MNKQVFTVEIELFESQKPLKDFQLFSAANGGLQELFDMSFRVSSVKETNVEQNVERHKNQQKMLDLLVKACEVIDAYERDDKTDTLDNLLGEINEFLDGKQ